MYYNGDDYRYRVRVNDYLTRVGFPIILAPERIYNMLFNHEFESFLKPIEKPRKPILNKPNLLERLFGSKELRQEEYKTKLEKYIIDKKQYDFYVTRKKNEDYMKALLKEEKVIEVFPLLLETIYKDGSFRRELDSTKKGKVGISENIFFEKTKNEFSEYLYTDKAVIKGLFIYHDGYKEVSYEPDIYLECENLKIIIEIDEPYTWNEKKPIHYSLGYSRHNSKRFIETSDKKRDKYLTDSGFIVIRISELQALSMHIRVCNFIKKFINQILNYECFNIDLFSSYILPAQQLIKSSYEIENQIKEQYRETYLSIYEVIDPIETDDYKIIMQFKDINNALDTFTSESSLIEYINQQMSFISTNYQTLEKYNIPTRLENSEYILLIGRDRKYNKLFIRLETRVDNKRIHRWY